MTGEDASPVPGIAIGDGPVPDLHSTPDAWEEVGGTTPGPHGDVIPGPPHVGGLAPP